MLTDAALVVGRETQRAQPKLTARENLGFELPIAKQNPLPDRHLAPGPNKRFPSLGMKFARKKNFDFARQMLHSCGPRRTLRMNSRAPPKQACRDYPRIVDYQELVATQKTREFRK